MKKIELEELATYITAIVLFTIVSAIGIIMVV